MIHYMNLHAEPFSHIACGSKTFELRLWDEKRRLIEVGDTIVFQNSDDERTLTCIVKGLHLFPNFEALYRALPLEKCGYLPQELPTASPKDMQLYYPPEKQARFGVVGIEIELKQ